MVDPEVHVRDALTRRDWDSALSLLMDAYGTALYRYCLRLVRDAHLAEDVLQDTFVKAHGALGAFKGQSTLLTWLYAIAHHRCLDALKADRRRAGRVEWTDDLPDCPDDRPGPERQLATTELAELLRRCVDKLSATVRAAVLARYHAGLTYPEMSVALGDDAKHLQIRVSRAMPVLRRCLERQGGQL